MFIKVNYFLILRRFFVTTMIMKVGRTFGRLGKFLRLIRKMILVNEINHYLWELPDPDLHVNFV